MCRVSFSYYLCDSREHVNIPPIVAPMMNDLFVNRAEMFPPLLKLLLIVDEARYTLSKSLFFAAGSGSLAIAIPNSFSQLKCITFAPLLQWRPEPSVLCTNRSASKFRRLDRSCDIHLERGQQFHLRRRKELF